TVQRVHHGDVDPVRERERGEAAVVVQDVEGWVRLLDPVECRRHVIGFVQRHLDLPGMGTFERRQHVGYRFRAGRCEQRDVVAALGQLGREKRYHLLDTAVSRGRHRYPRGRQHRDPHSLLPMSSPLGAVPNLSETIVIKDGNVFMVTLRDGRLPPGVEHPLGLWFRDCRFLSAHELRVCGELPRVLTATDAEGTASVHELTNPDLELEGGEQLPAETLRLRIERRAEAGGALRQTIGVRSYHRGPLRLPLQVELGADFLPMLELRGIVPRHERPSPDGAPGAFSLVGRDGIRRTTAVRATPEPRLNGAGALVFDLDLDPRGGIDITLDFEVSEHADGELAAAIPQRPRLEGTRVTSDDQLFNRILQRSLDDLELLRSELDGQSYYAAGLPWFATLFGRDSLITAFETLSIVPGVAESTLRLLAGRLGTEVNDERD